MSDLYRTVKKLPAAELSTEGFRHDKLKEGFFKRLSADRSIVFHVAGMWSHVDLHSGIRFDAVNTSLYDAAVRAGWPRERSKIFRLELVAMFWEKLGDFCGMAEDLGVYCPPNSTIASAGEICLRVLQETTRLSRLADAAATVAYMRERSLYEPFGRYMIPAAAKLDGDSSLWDWSIDYFAKSVSDDDRVSYRALIAALEQI